MFSKAQEFERSFKPQHLGTWGSTAETSKQSPGHGSPKRSGSPNSQQLVDANGRFLPGVAMKEKSAFNLQDDGGFGTPARWPQPNAAVKVGGGVKINGKTTKALARPPPHVCSKANCSCGR